MRSNFVCWNKSLFQWNSVPPTPLSQIEIKGAIERDRDRDRERETETETDRDRGQGEKANERLKDKERGRGRLMKD